MSGFERELGGEAHGRGARAPRAAEEPGAPGAATGERLGDRGADWERDRGGRRDPGAERPGRRRLRQAGHGGEAPWQSPGGEGAHREGLESGELEVCLDDIVPSLRVELSAVPVPKRVARYHPRRQALPRGFRPPRSLAGAAESGAADTAGAGLGRRGVRLRRRKRRLRSKADRYRQTRWTGPTEGHIVISVGDFVGYDQLEVPLSRPIVMAGLPNQSGACACSAVVRNAGKGPAEILSVRLLSPNS